mmetsp:Transcript_89435/g.268862  ORF Transcript_89435/g.268862 Transcript_89435/m.268862 type:complete len:260 (-) Transcript_89435:76-855(-)
MGAPVSRNVPRTMALKASKEPAPDSITRSKRCRSFPPEHCAFATLKVSKASSTRCILGSAAMDAIMKVLPIRPFPLHRRAIRPKAFTFLSFFSDTLRMLDVARDEPPSSPIGRKMMRPRSPPMKRNVNSSIWKRRDGHVRASTYFGANGSEKWAGIESARSKYAEPHHAPQAFHIRRTGHNKQVLASRQKYGQACQAVVDIALVDARFVQPHDGAAAFLLLKLCGPRLEGLPFGVCRIMPAVRQKDIDLAQLPPVGQIT